MGYARPDFLPLRFSSLCWLTLETISSPFLVLRNSVLNKRKKLYFLSHVIMSRVHLSYKKSFLLEHWMNEWMNEWKLTRSTCWKFIPVLHMTTKNRWRVRILVGGLRTRALGRPSAHMRTSHVFLAVPSFTVSVPDDGRVCGSQWHGHADGGQRWFSCWQ